MDTSLVPCSQYTKTSLPIISWKLEKIWEGTLNATSKKFRSLKFATTFKFETFSPKAILTLLKDPSKEAFKVYQKVKDLENAGVACVEVEVVPVELAEFITKNTNK